MILSVKKSTLSGSVRIPASKSHTIRAVAISSLADGTSRIVNPLVSADTLSAVSVYRKLGAGIDTGNEWTVAGTGGPPPVPDDVLDVGNSGTSLYVAMGSAGLTPGYSVFTGDEQIRSRPADPLLQALTDLGAEAFSTRGNGKPPLVIRGPIRGGRVSLDGSKTSQYLSSLLLACPLAQGDTEISVHNPVEKPFIEMTLGWLDSQGIEYERTSFERFAVKGGQNYHAFEKSIPADFSSAAFFLCAAAVTGSELTLPGLDMSDTQGDKVVVDMLEQMGADVQRLPDAVRIKGNRLHGGEFDLGGTPDALPALAVTACFAEGTTRLVNVAQARLKETDRISVMREELSKMGGTVEELPDGLVITGTRLHAADVSGHSDHRVVMALAVAGLACEGVTRIDTAESMSVTFPTFVVLMHSAGANMETSPSRVSSTEN